jgi:hypothetical protein
MDNAVLTCADGREEGYKEPSRIQPDILPRQVELLVLCPSVFQFQVFPRFVAFFRPSKPVGSCFGFATNLCSQFLFAEGLIESEEDIVVIIKNLNTIKDTVQRIVACKTPDTDQLMDLLN